MNYRGPQAADFANVQALNLAFLGLRGLRAAAEAKQAGMPDVLLERFHGLTAVQRERLAKSPFLLFSFREDDNAFWDQVFRAGPNGNLFEARAAHDQAYTELLGAALGFVWQLARDNTYAARLVCGASLYWCEQLAERPLLQIVRLAAAADIIRLRRQHDPKFWQKLLHGGVAGEPKIRRAARICALQRLLTENPEPAAGVVSRAARQLPRPALKVADGNEH